MCYPHPQWSLQQLVVYLSVMVNNENRICAHAPFSEGPIRAYFQALIITLDPAYR